MTRAMLIVLFSSMLLCPPPLWGQISVTPKQLPAKGEKGSKSAAAKKPSDDEPVEKVKKWDGKTVASSDPTQSRVEVSLSSKGKSLLLVRHPWKAYSKPSVEIRFLSDDEVDNREVRPLQFVKELLKGDVTMALYQAMGLTEDTRFSKSFKQDDLEFDVIGHKNHLGRVATAVVFPPRDKGDDPSARVVYYPVDPWAADAENLRLEIPAQYFAKPGRVRVWFLREGTVVWWQTVIWPGAGKPAAATLE